MKKFIKRLIEELKEENKRIAKGFASGKEINIPFILVPLEQHLHKVTEFKNDITMHKYEIRYFEDTTGGYTNGYVDVMIKNPQSKDKHDEFYDYYYRINLLFETANLFECDCTQDMEWYREDKDCCGDGCLWDSPSFEVEKIYHIGKHTFEGKEKDYWDYEESYYKKDEEALKAKAEREAREKIDKLTTQIAKMNKELVLLQESLKEEDEVYEIS